MSERQDHEQHPSQETAQERELPATIATKDAVARAIFEGVQSHGGGDSATAPDGDTTVRYRIMHHGARVEFATAEPTSNRPERPETISQIYDFNYHINPHDPRLAEVDGINEDGTEHFRELGQTEAQALLGRMQAVGQRPAADSDPATATPDDHLATPEQDQPATSATIGAVGRDIRDKIQTHGGPRHNSVTIPTGEVSQVMLYNTENGARVLFSDEEQQSTHPTKPEAVSTVFEYNESNPDHPRLGQIGWDYTDRGTIEETFRNLNQAEAEALLARIQAIRPYERRQQNQ